MATPTLSAEVSKWAEGLGSTDGKSVSGSTAIAQKVEHVLSKATVRGPQKDLFKTVLPFIPKMLGDVSGITILTSLVKYGTPKTVEGVMKAVVVSDEDMWAMKKEPAKELASSFGRLLDSLVYREDAREETCQRVIDALSAGSPEKLLSSSFTLPAAGRLFALDPKFAARVTKDAKGKKALHTASVTAAEKEAVVSFCESILKVDDDNAAASKYLFEVFFTPAPDGVTRPREEVILAMTSKATPDVVAKIAKVFQKWTNLQELLKREAYANIYSETIARSNDEEAAKKLALSLFTTAGEVDAMLAGRKKPYLRLLAMIDEKPAIVAALEKKLGAPLGGKLRGSKVRYTNATVPRATATQLAIMAKLQRLNGGEGGSATHAAIKKSATKRPRE